MGKESLEVCSSGNGGVPTGAVNITGSDINAPVETKGLILSLIFYRCSNVANVVNIEKICYSPATPSFLLQSLL
jgi:hypothetical protein